MEIILKYFGVIAEITQKEEETLFLDTAPATLHSIRKIVEKKYADLEQQNFSMAVNHKLSDPKTEIKNNDIIALLPPFAGG